MRRFLTILFMLISMNIFGQNLNECGLDNDPRLSQTESEFLNEYISGYNKQSFDFTNKKVIFVTGPGASRIGTMSEYFDAIKEWKANGDTIATWVVVLDDKEKIASGGYDAIVTYWVKLLTKKRKRKIIKQIAAHR